MSFAHIFGTLKPISLDFSLTLPPLVSNRQHLTYPPAADVICGQPLTCEEIPRLLVLGGMSSRWERGAEGGDCDSGADKAKQQEVSTNTNTITNTNKCSPNLHYSLGILYCYAIAFSVPVAFIDSKVHVNKIRSKILNI